MSEPLFEHPAAALTAAQAEELHPNYVSEDSSNRAIPTFEKPGFFLSFGGYSSIVSELYYSYLAVNTICF